MKMFLLCGTKDRRTDCFRGPCPLSSFDFDDKLRSFTCKSTGYVFKEYTSRESTCTNGCGWKKRLHGNMDNFVQTPFLLGSRKLNYFVT